MALSNKAKNFIQKHHTKKSVRELAESLKADETEVQQYIDEIAPKLPLKKKILFYTITLSIPFLFFLLVEVILRSTDYLGNTDLFVNPEISEGQYLMPNPNFAARYFFYTSTIPNPSIDAFLKDKPENSFRIFAMGGSSAAGYPYGFNGTFSRVVDDILSDAFPEKNIEVVNVATSAISTYTLFDQVDEIIEQKPDAIMIYAGHNEFYGALGIGSNENIGAFPAFVRFYLKLQRFKTFLFLREIMTETGKWISMKLGSADNRAGTLMERIIRNQSIGMNSAEFELAMRQFESNMEAIAQKFSEHDIPVYVATIASNIKDQPPFVSIDDEQLPRADSVFSIASKAYQKGEIQSSKQQFQYAKDLDGLKFRAPSKINEIIKKLSASFEDVIMVPALEELEAHAEHGIIGNDLMLEHLHPNQKGYFIIGKSFADVLLNDLAKKDSASSFQYDPEKYLTEMQLTEFDHQVVDHRIRTLKQGFPFQLDEVKPYQVNYRPEGLLDSLAFITVHKNKRWDEAKLELAQFYETTRQNDKALKEYLGLIRNQPWNDSPYQFAARLYLDRNEYSEAYLMLNKAYEIAPADAFTTKMLGALELRQGNITAAIKLLEESRTINPDDPQMLYNLSGAYGQNNEFEKALEIAEAALEKNPDFPGIREWHSQLSRIINTRNN